MASTPPAPAIAELSEVSTLAQKLFDQCRDAPSSYKLLATSVRNLRNALEEVEADYDPTRTLGPDDVKLLNQIGRSHDILSRLDLSLQSYRSSGQEGVNMNAVSDLKTALDVCTHQLTLAWEATTTGEIPLKLDTRDFPSQHNISASIEDSSASRSRKSSMWSLAKDGPRSPGASDGTSVHNDRIDRSAGEEKQLLSPPTSGASDARGSMDFRSPFADPMSMGFEAATSFILGGDDDLTMTAYARPRSRSRAESTVSAATETFVSAPASPEMEREPTSFSIDSTSTTEAQSPPEDQIASSMGATGLNSESKGVADPPESRSSSMSRVEEEHLSSSTATRELALQRPRTNSNISTGEGAQVDTVNLPPSAVDDAVSQDGSTSATITSRPNSSHAVTTENMPLSSAPSTSSVPVLASPPESKAQSPAVDVGSDMASPDQTAADAENFAKDLSKTMDAALQLSSDQQAAIFKPLPPSPATDASSSDTPEQQQPASPPPPQRRPPPPPPPPVAKRSKPNVKLTSAKSRYRIVNDASGDSSSDDELYSSSRPNSPDEGTSWIPMQSPPLATPTIQIDQSALDDVQDDVGVDASSEVRDAQDVNSTSGDAPQLPRTVYTSPKPTKPRIFSSPPVSNPTSPQISEHVQNQNAKTQAPPIPSPRSSKPSQRRQSPPQSPPLPPSVQKRIEAAVKAGDRLLAKEIETQFQQEKEDSKPPTSPESKPPPIPPRPKSRYNRPRASTAISSPAALAEKELAAESGLEIKNQSLADRPQNSRLVPRVSVDHALNVDTTSAPEVTGPLDGARHSRAASTSQLPSPQFSLRDTRPTPAAGVDGHRLAGWYGPRADETPRSELDNERVEHICHFWNNMAWHDAEQYLMAYLESLIEQGYLALARRVRHLLGVCASFNGDFTGAVGIFLTNLEISEPADLSKPGNCEACYWLGDLYTLQNQRLEALLAYSAAQWGETFRDPEEPNLGDLVKAEQEAVQLGMPKTEYQLRCAREAKEGCGSILDPRILPPAVVKYLFEVEPRRHGRSARPFQLDANKPRSSSFVSLSSSAQAGKFRRSNISTEHFFSWGPWPLQYDPTFTMANVKRERLLGSETDILTFLQTNHGDSKLPKINPMSLSRMDCFTCGDLAWLITAVRDCLKMLEMEWSEVANDQGAWFIVRHTLMDGLSKNPAMKIATVHYFAISLFRQSFLSSYGVEVCSHGVSSARVLDPSNLEYDRGAHQGEARRIKKLVTETLEAAEKRRPKSNSLKWRQSSIGLGISSRSSSDDQPVKMARPSSDGRPPPIPPRPKKSGGSGA